ncbi:MAG: CheY-like chemotaxis protein, partial [Rheinheimera aquimaris]
MQDAKYMSVLEAKKQTILIVDDQAGNVALLSDILGDLGDIYFVLDSTQAYEKTLELQPDVVLLDIE